MFERSLPVFVAQIEAIKRGGTWKEERVITSAQGAEINVGERRVLNFCANNYLGLSNHPALVAAASNALARYGYGLASARFISGTHELHRQLEVRLAEFLATDDVVLFGSCFDANVAVFEALLDGQDAVISDELNHASIIDGIRLCKASRFRYAHANMADLELQLAAAESARVRLIVTDGVFSMEGDYAPLSAICDLADRHGALVMVDDSHATGFIGPTGRGTPERFDVMKRVDLITSTLGKALGGGAGGFIACRHEIADLLRQRARAYLFSNSLSPTTVGASMAALDLLTQTATLRDRLMSNARRFREQMARAEFDFGPGDHPIVPILIGDDRLTVDIARDLLAEGIYVIGFSHPVVPRGQARIRVQLSAAHTDEQIDQAVRAFTVVARRRGVLIPAH
jgi:glycine C-acetyltransferase